MTHAPIKNNNYLTFYKKKTTRITSKKKKKNPWRNQLQLPKKTSYFICSPLPFLNIVECMRKNSNNIKSL